jgi:cytochrome c553
MKFRVAHVFTALGFTAASAICVAQVPPDWAYPVNPPGFKLAPDDGTLRRVPGSSATFTLTQTRDRFLSPDWHPEDHPPQPEVVARGRKPDVWACGFCHRADGPGGPENANLAGLSAAYIVQQMADYKSGARKTSVAGRNVDFMIAIAKAATDAEVQAAAAYFSSLKQRLVIRVLETDSVPRVYVTGWHLAAINKGEQDALGQRIIEMPEAFEHFEVRDARTTFVAYVPKGSIGKGQALATTGGAGRTVACAGCHGADLKGADAAPGIAGRSPTYLFRQFYDLKNGTRAGTASLQMKATVENLTVEDMIALAAYAASLKP